ncbi:RodZ domain-containing protein [Aurantivibrio plasticivorans]
MSDENDAIMTTSTDSALPENTPGNMLRQAREQSGHSLESIAAELNLTVDKLRAIEADEYDKLASHVFALGYIKRCAKILAVDENQIAARFNQLTKPQTETSEDEVPEPSSSISNGVKPQLMMPAVVFGAALIILIGVFTLSSDNSEEQLPVPVKQSETSDEIREQPDSDSEMAGATENTNSVANEILNPVGAVPSALSEAEVSPMESVAPSTQFVTNNVATSTPASEETTTPEPVSTGDGSFDLVRKQLSFSFSEDCWLKVTDGTGEVLHAQLQTAGSNLVLESIVPTQIMLGNARVVSLDVAGEPFAINPLPGRDTIKFVIE